MVRASLRSGPVVLDGLRVVDARTEARADRGDVRREPVRRHRGHDHQAGAEIARERVGAHLIALADEPRGDEPGRGAQRGEGVRVAETNSLFRGRDARLFLADVRPDFVHLNVADLEVVREGVVQPRRALPEAKSEARDRRPRNGSHALDGAL